MKEREHRDAGNASGFDVSTRCARSPLRFDPSDDTPNPEPWKFAMAGRGLPAMTDRLLTTKSRGDSGMRLTSIPPAGNYRLSRAQYQSEYTLFSPSDCPTNQDHLSSHYGSHGKLRLDSLRTECGDRDNADPVRAFVPISGADNHTQRPRVAHGVQFEAVAHPQQRIHGGIHLPGPQLHLECAPVSVAESRFESSVSAILGTYLAMSDF